MSAPNHGTQPSFDHMTNSWASSKGQTYVNTWFKTFNQGAGLVWPLRRCSGPETHWQARGPANCLKQFPLACPGLDQLLEVFLTGTARTRQCFGPGESGPGR